MLAKIARTIFSLRCQIATVSEFRLPVKILGGSHLLTESYLPDKQKDFQFGFP